MILKSIDYVENEGEPKEWRLKDFTLGQVNLLVGKNATGKTRSLNLVRGLAHLVSGYRKLTPLRSGRWKVVFSHEGDSPVYELNIRESKVQRESFTFQGRKCLNRLDGGKGRILAEQLGKEIDFQTPENELAVVARRDNIQHPFFEPLYNWGDALRHFPFAANLGKKKPTFASDSNGEEFNSKDADQVGAIFRKGQECYDDSFVKAILEDMKRIGYPIKEICLAAPTSVTINGPLAGEAVFLRVQESDLRAVTDQFVMSQGMFRALSVIIQLNYSYLADNPSCILIDDIGEGLDFERSSALIKLLVEKAERANVQLVMTTNDRFVMNNVPLEMWSVLQRKSGECNVYNYENSREKFDEFKFTGLNNFDFLATDFLNSKSLPDA